MYFVLLLWQILLLILSINKLNIIERIFQSSKINYTHCIFKLQSVKSIIVLWSVASQVNFKAFRYFIGKCQKKTKLSFFSVCFLRYHDLKADFEAELHVSFADNDIPECVAKSSVKNVSQDGYTNYKYTYYNLKSQLLTQNIYYY